MFALSVDGDIRALAGISIEQVLHHERHVWVHDFVTDSSSRSAGYGTELLSFVEQWAHEQGCDTVALAVRAGNDEASRFYAENGMDEWGSLFEHRLE